MAPKREASGSKDAPLEISSSDEGSQIRRGSTGTAKRAPASNLRGSFSKLQDDSLPTGDSTAGHQRPAASGQNDPKRKREPTPSSDEDSEPIHRPSKRPATVDPRVESSPMPVPEPEQAVQKVESATPAAQTTKNQVPVERAGDSSSRPARKAPASNKAKGTELTLPEVDEDDELRNMDRWLKAKNNVFVKNGNNIQNFMETDSSAQRLQKYVTGPKYGDRAVSRAAKVLKTSGAWRPKFVSAPDDTTFIKKGLSVGIPTDFYSKEEYDAICGQLVCILDRLPIIVTEELVKKRSFPQLLLNIAVETALPDSTLRRNAISYHPPNPRKGEVGSKGRYETAVYYFDEATSDLGSYYIYVPIFLDASMAGRVPEVPAKVSFSRAAGMVTTSAQLPTTDPEEVKAHEATITWAKFLSWKLTGVLGTKASLDELRTMYEQTFGITGRQVHKLRFYKGNNICSIKYSGYETLSTVANDGVFNRVRSKKGSCRISPSDAVKNDVSGELPDIVLKVSGEAKVHHVVKNMHETWVATQDIIETWEAGLRAGDRVNEGTYEESAGSTCSCTEESSKHTPHLCDHCYRPSLCSELSRREKSLQRWCPECVEKWLDEFKDTEKNVSFRRMKQQLGALIRHDERQRQKLRSGSRHASILDHSQQFAEGTAAIETLLHDRSTFTWLDGYNKNKRTDTALGQQRGIYIDPFLPTIEAALPYCIWQNEYYSHVADNLTVTAYYLNRAKSLFPPALLGLLGRYFNSKQVEADKKTLISTMHVLHEIVVKVPYAKKARYAAPTDPLKMARDEKEWTEVVLLPTKNEPWKGELWQVVSRLTASSVMDKIQWRPSGWRRILKVVDQIEDRFNLTLLRQNECPYFLDPSDIPRNWSWHVCWQLLGRRLSRMEEVCNNKWDTIDCIETIFLECVWQACDPAMGDLFKLPMTVWIRHPLRFAVAHHVHGFQMRTRWIKDAPESIEDRNDDLNNISIETAFTNYAKDNVPNALYGQLQEDIKSVQVDEKWFKPSIRTGTKVDDEGIELAEEMPEEVDNDDGFSEDEYRDGSDSSGEDDDTPALTRRKSSSTGLGSTKKGKQVDTGTTKAPKDSSNGKAASGGKKSSTSKKSQPGIKISDDGSSIKTQAERDQEIAGQDDELLDERAQNYISSTSERIDDEDVPITAGISEEQGRLRFIARQLRERLADLEQQGDEVAAERAVIRCALEMLEGDDQ